MPFSGELGARRCACELRLYVEALRFSSVPEAGVYGGAVARLAIYTVRDTSRLCTEMGDQLFKNEPIFVAYR